MVRLEPDSFDPAAQIAAFSAQSTGAIVTFLGTVRPHANGQTVQALELQHYSGMTEREIGTIIDMARARFDIDDVLVIHRIGRVAVNDPIVLVCAASAHRRAAFDAVDFLMDYLKSEAPFWKKEICDGRSQWIEPRAEDYKDKARWNDRSRPAGD